MIINVDKPYGWTSSDVVRKLRNVMLKSGYPRKVKIGHAGTLDPLATGVLVVCTEKDTKRVEELQAQRKEYVFTVCLGATTVSYDLEHPVSEHFPYEHITRQAVEAVLDSMRGPQEQIPPLYSAKRIDGKRAYQYARQGEEVELRKAQIEIYDIELLDFDLPYVKLRVECSKGTYVRSLARDLALDLDSGGHLTDLRRTASGNLKASDGLSIQAASDILAQGPDKD